MRRAPAELERLKRAALAQPGARERASRMIKFPCPACRAEGYDNPGDNAVCFVTEGQWGCAWAKDTDLGRAHWRAIGEALGALKDRDGRWSSEETTGASCDTGDYAASGSGWSLYDGADQWTFPPVEFTVDLLLPAFGVVWWGGLPKRYKSLLCLYMCLAIASARDTVADRFTIRRRPRILYVTREDSGSRLQDRRDDILSAWSIGPAPGAIRFLIRPRFDLLNAAHVAWLRETCQREGITLLVLDTWTALSPGADPMAAKDQAQLAATVVELAEAIGGAVVVVDHTRKNRADGQPISSADIYGPQQKWAAAEHIVMFDLTADRRQLECFIESKDSETRRMFLAVTPKGASGEKFTYAGTVEEIADAQREKGNQNRNAVYRILIDSGTPLTPKEVLARAQERRLGLREDTISKHLRGLAKTGKASVTGKGPATQYLGIPDDRRR